MFLVVLLVLLLVLLLMMMRMSVPRLDEAEEDQPVLLGPVEDPQPHHGRHRFPRNLVPRRDVRHVEAVVHFAVGVDGKVAAERADDGNARGKEAVKHLFLWESFFYGIYF